MNKWIEVELKAGSIQHNLKQIEDEFEYHYYHTKSTYVIYKNFDKWLKVLLELAKDANISIAFIPCFYERYDTEVSYYESYESFDYITYVNLNKLIYKQSEVVISPDESATQLWKTPFTYPYNELVDKIKTHIVLAKPKCKYKNLIKLERWEYNNPFTFNPWDSHAQDRLEVHVDIDKYLCQLNTKHPDYKKAQAIIAELELKEFEYEFSFKTFKKFDTKSSQDNRILCFMVDILDSKITNASNFIENDARINLRKALKIIKKIDGNSHPSEVINLAAIMRDILQQPDYEKMLDGLENMFSNDESIQNKALLKLGKIYSGTYEREQIKSDVFKTYNNFYQKITLYLKQIGLIQYE